MRSPFTGIHVALPTPFRDGRLDLDAFRGLVEWHAARRTEGIVVCGTTGEASTLNDYERRSLIHAAVELSEGRLQVMAGVGCNCTTRTVELARFATSLDVDGLLVVTPYYNKPSPAGLFAHYSAVAEATDTPIVLYNVPSRTAVDLGSPVVAALAERFDHIVAIKEASTHPERVRELRERCDLGVLCGEDSLFLEFLEAGAVGTVSVLANVAPDEMAELQDAQEAGDTARARQLALELAPLVRALFVESSPVPLKAALARMQLCSDEVRLPLAPLEPASRRVVEEALEQRAAGMRAAGPV